MSKIFKLKNWLNIEDAASRLSKTFEEEVTVNDLIQLAFEKEIDICWFLNNQYVQEVKFSITVVLTEKSYQKYKESNTLPEQFREIPNSIDNETIFSVIQDFGLLPNPENHLSNGVRAIGEPFRHTGPLKIDLNTGAMTGILADYLTNESNQWICLDGMVLRNENNKLFQPVDLLPLTNEQIEKGQGKRIPYPTDNTPRLCDLVFLRSDIEKFESQFKEPATNVKLRTPEESLINSLGIMCILLSNCSKKYSNGNKPNFSQITKAIEQEAAIKGIELKEISNLSKSLSMAYKSLK